LGGELRIRCSHAILPEMCESTQNITNFRL
jgi:hypothetical protein